MIVKRHRLIVSSTSPYHDNMLPRTSDGRRDIIEISDMGWRHHEAELRGLASVTGAKFILFTRGICWIERRRERGGSSLQPAVKTSALSRVQAIVALLRHN